jgi:phenylacetate-CoA ligase
MCDKECGGMYNGQLLKEVIGRTSDVVSFKNGHKLTTTGFSILFRNFNVEAFRMVKKNDSTILVQIQKHTNYTQTEHDLLYETIRKYVGDEVEIIIEYVDSFVPLANGKRSYLYNQ